MMKSDGFFGRFLNQILDQMILNFLFLVCGIGIVTLPASLGALYAVELKIQRGEEPNVAVSFFQEFHFLQTLGIFCILLAGAAPAFLAWYGCAQWGFRFPGFVHWILAFWVLCVFGVGCWIFPLTARYENTLRGTLGNAVTLCFTFFPTTLLLIVIALIFPTLFAVMPRPMLLIYTGFLVFFSFAISVRLAVIPVSRVFSKISPEEDYHEV